jgi:all-trans-retinol 13,14-reductase
MGGIHKESRREAYDVIVVGAGVGGLSAAALLAKAGKSVLLVERHDRPGGYAHGFHRKHYRFDSGVHLVSGCGPSHYRHGGVIHKLCRAVGINPEACFVPVSPYARAVYPGLEIALHSGEDAFVGALAEAFPEERRGLSALANLCRRIAEESMLADEMLERAKTRRLSPLETLPHLFRYRRAILSDVLDEYLNDTRLKSLCASLWPYLGLPPSKVSFLFWAAMMAGYVHEGGYYCRGSFQNYVNLLAEAVERHGGEVLLNSSVRSIRVENGRAAGVVLENAQVIRADAVVSNVDARQTAEMIGRHRLPEGQGEALAGLTPSLSVFVSYLATDLAWPDSAHESFFYERFDHEASHALAARGQADWFSVTVPTLADPSLAPPGRHVVLLTTLCPYDIGESWRTAKPRFQEKLLERAERRFPGLGKHLLWLESGSPRTLERYTLNHAGAAYGWAPTPEQIGPNRPGVRGVLPGLYHAGHWTRPGGGVAAVSVSGLLAAQAVLGIAGPEEFWRELGVEP